MGFQSGAREAAKLTNVQVTSLAVLAATTKDEIYGMRLRELFDRIEDCNRRYWEIPKSTRIQSGLRPDTGEVSYSGTIVIALCRDLISRALRGSYPIMKNDLQVFFDPSLPAMFESAESVVHVLEAQLGELERRLAAAS